MKPGSSPLTRGKRRRFPGHRVERGLIPAHAGKTSRHACRSPPIWAHPRSRGENIKSAVGSVIDWGSSPLTRGKRGEVGGDANEVGLIPAHAGKTLSMNGLGLMWRAHPRSRGENFQIGMPRSASWGSSPLTRGKLAAWPSTDSGAGLIPAHAGKTRRRMRLS